MTEIHDEPKDPLTGARDPVERIKSVLDEKLGADAERIDVSVEDDVVILEGSGIARKAFGRVVPASLIWRR
jgi:osmotically-inducible protein OsmY